MVATNGCQSSPSFMSYQQIYLEVSVLFDCGGQFLFDMFSHFYHNSTETEGKKRENLLQPMKSLQKFERGNTFHEHTVVSL